MTALIPERNHSFDIIDLAPQSRSLRKRRDSENAMRPSQLPTSTAKRLRNRPCIHLLVEQVTPDPSHPSPPCQPCQLSHPSHPSHPSQPSRPRQPSQPHQFEPVDTRTPFLQELETVDAITAVLEKTCLTNQTCVKQNLRSTSSSKPPYRSHKYPDGTTSIFFSLNQPNIILRDYVTRLVRYMHVSKSVFIVSLIYLDRIRHDDQLLSLTYLNVHRLLTTSVAVASKFLEDESHRNSTVSKIGGVPTLAEMNMLETQFLRRLHWNCAVDPSTYHQYHATVFGS